MPKLQFRELPEELIAKIGDYSYGGFILFYFDSQGHPCCATEAPEPSDDIALRKYASDFLEAVDKADKLDLLESMMRRPPTPTTDSDDSA